MSDPRRASPGSTAVAEAERPATDDALREPQRQVRVEREMREDGPVLVVHATTLPLERAQALWKALGRELRGRRRRARAGQDRAPRVDLSQVQRATPTALALLLERVGWDRGRIIGAGEHLTKVLDLLQPPPEEAAPRAAPGLLSDLGAATLRLTQGARDAAGFLGQSLSSGAAALRHPGSVRWRDVPALIERTGADALPAACVVTFLAGLMLAFQAATPILQFGATEVLAEIVGLAVVRHLGPFMTALMVAGRSGSAFAAELGTMRVSREVDALRIMGIDPLRFLVFPRVLALVLVLPLLTAVADLAGVLGGLVVGMSRMDLTVFGYFRVLREGLELSDLIHGFVKAIVFGLAISVIGCQRGLATRGGPEDVGRATTSAVVLILFALVLIDAVFAIVSHFYGM